MAPGLALGACFGASFFFALAESSLFSINQWQLRQLEAQSAAGKAVAELLARPRDLLAAIVLGNSFANAAIVGIALWFIMEQGWPAGWTLAAAAVLVLFGAEVAPKALGVRAPELWALRVAAPMGLLLRGARPLLRLSQWVVDSVLPTKGAGAPKAQGGFSDAEYGELLEMACQQGTLAAGERDIILRIVNLDRRQAKDVMKPRSQMACIADDLPLEGMVASARRFKHRRLPMYDETPDTIVGVLNTRALLMDPDQDLSMAVEFPSFVPASMNLLELLKALQRQQRGLAIVLDEFGGTAGVVTIEDIMAEVVGEFRRPEAAPGFVMEKLGRNRWRVSGAMRLDDFRREYPPLAESPGVETMGGLVMNLLQIVPEPGQTVSFSGLYIKVKAVEGRRIRELLVRAARRR